MNHGSRVLPAAGSLLLVALAAAAVPACTRYVELDRGPQAHYQTSFPITDTSGELGRALGSVKRIMVAVEYDTYLFPEGVSPTEAELDDPAILERATDTLAISRTRSATAVLVSVTSRNVGLVTANHAVHYPDTVAEYYRSEGVGVADGSDGRRIRSLSVKRRQSNWIVGLPDVATFEVLAFDDESDVALIGFEYPEDEEIESVRPLPVANGDPGRLSWGAFVYVLGHPSGYPMATRGIVSLSYGDESDSFVVDGLWNEGMSGGPVLAVRGDDGSLEWVGMARAASARSEARIVPPEGAVEQHDPDEPYEGPVYLEEVPRIQYGIMLSVPVTAIRRLIDDRRDDLQERGYRFPTF